MEENENNQSQAQCANSSESKRRQMITRIKELNFSIIELSLYLNTHPENRRAICMHRNYTRELKELEDKYQRIYGPLTIYYPCNKWRWVEEPWPWERGNY